MSLFVGKRIHPTYQGITSYLSKLISYFHVSFYRYGFNHHCHLSHPLPNTKETETNSRQDQGGAKEKLYESKLNFFTHITHELCTPLTLINGVENYIQAYAATSKDKTLEKYTSVLRENVEELNGLIQEILDFPESGRRWIQSYAHRRVSVPLFCELNSNGFTHYRATPNPIQDRCSKELYWNTDSVYFKKILANLISNAFKYTEDGGTVRISLHEEENFLVLKVYNTGKGIEDADMQNIFDRYRILGTMDNDDNRQNTARNGLGLFICHSLVQSLGGKIDIESEVGQYAEFTVTLPFGIVEEELRRHDRRRYSRIASFPKHGYTKAANLTYGTKRDGR